jgi:hypothetical protein
LRALHRRRALWVRVAIAVPLFLAAVFVLSVHFVTSEDDGLRIIRKQHPTWRETVVSLDEMTTIPYEQAKARFPLALRALQREGILETDEEREARIAAEQAELERELTEQRAQADRELSDRMDQAAQDVQDRMEEATERVRDRMHNAMSPR